MIRLVHAEWTRLRSTRLFYAMAASVIASVGLTVAASITNLEGVAPGVELDSSDGIRAVLGGASSAGQLVLVLAIMGIAGEFRHGTISQTFLATPRRGRVIAAKIAAFAIVGLGLGILAAAATMAIGVPWLAAKGVEVSLFSGAVGHALGGAILTSLLYGVIGVGIGAAIPNQTLAITGSLMWLLVVEGLLVSFVPEVGRWLLGGVASAIAGAGTMGADALPLWLAGVVMVGYAAVLAFTGMRSIATRDIT